MGTSTVSSKKRSKATKSALAVVLALALALGGTFATFYGTQMDLGEGARLTATNPGGRVHDDFGNRVETGNVVTFDKNVYAESFTDREGKGEYLVARVRLKNYAAVNTDANNPDKAVDADKTAGTYGQVDTYTTVSFDGTNFHSNLQFGESTVEESKNKLDVKIYSSHDYASTSTDENGQYKYMPTFNKQMDGEGALKVDVKGEYSDGYKGYPHTIINGALSSTETKDEIYDGGEQFQNTHKVTLTVPDYRGVTTLSAWNELSADQQDNWWVYDESESDTNGNGGWFYWSSPLLPTTATGLLLDGLEVVGNNLDWYYALNVEGEFITVDTERAPDGSTYYWNDEEGKERLLPNEKVNALVDSIQDMKNSYTARVSYAIDQATILSDASVVADPANGGAYTKALVDLKENVDSTNPADQELQVYVLYKDEKERQALVTTRYLSSLWGNNGNGVGPYAENDAIYDWKDSIAREWCNTTYLESLPSKLQKMIPEKEIVYFGAPSGSDFCNSTSNDQVFFLSRADCTIAANSTDFTDYTVSDVVLFEGTAGEGEDRAKIAAKSLADNQATYYWNRSGMPSGEASVVSAISGGGWLYLEKPFSTTHRIGARPAFWINY